MARLCAHYISETPPERLWFQQSFDGSWFPTSELLNAGASLSTPVVTESQLLGYILSVRAL